MSVKIKKEIREFEILLRSVPSPIIALFAISVIVMNLLANKSLELPFDWLALDCGIIVSWVSFLSMDIITKHFGAKASTEISLFAVILNLLTCGILLVAGSIPGVWGESYVEGSEAIINTALDNTFSGTWYILFGSTVAFVLSAVVNNFLNAMIGKLIKKENSFKAYAVRSYISTAFGQFTDNLTFSLIVSHFFFGWTLLQCVTCSLTGMVVELLCEVLFSPIGFRVCRKWRSEKIGEEYFRLKNGSVTK
jgi:hypothetical protein